MVIEFRFRKNVRGGCVLIHPRLCAETSEKARLISPTRKFWPLVAGTCDVNKPLFAKKNSNSANQQLKAAIMKLNYDQGRKYFPHAFRVGATEGVKDSGSTFATIIKSGTWTPAGYKSYIDVQADEAINISKLLIDTVNSDSDDTDPEQLPAEQRPRSKVT